MTTQINNDVTFAYEMEEEIVSTSTTTTVSSKIRELTAKGMKRGEIAKQLGIRYQHVRNVQLQVLKRKDLK